jgi:uncharacterized protein YllA (UPF0747 family)
MIDKMMMISAAELGGESKLFLDYVSGGDTPIRDILGGFERGEERWARRSAVGGESASWTALVDRLVEYNRSLGVSDEVVDKLSGAREGGEVGFVVSGQQPGALGGPLLALYKLSTAVELAAYIEDTHGTPCIPLYWVGSDDVDFREINELFLVDCDLTPLSTSIDNAAHTAASPVGDIPAAADARLWEAVEPVVARCPHGRFVGDLVRSSIDGAADHGVVAARVVARLSGGRAALVDGREPALRTRARDLYLEFFDREEQVREAVAAAGGAFEGLGYHAQLWLGPDSGLFVVEDGQRKKISPAHRASARDRLAREVTSFSPGVVLRNLVQDRVFQPVAVVLGPAEIAYRAQLDGVYRLLDVARPIAFPRMQATYLTPFVAALPGADGAADIAGLISDPASFVKTVYASHHPSEVGRSAGRFKRVFDAEAEAFLEAAKAALDERTAAKTRKRLADVSRRLGQALNVGDKAGKDAALGQWPFLAALPDFLRRNDKPQERYLSALAPFLFGGEGAREGVFAAAAAYAEGALDGRLSHVVYSTAE